MGFECIYLYHTAEKGTVGRVKRRFVLERCF
jgi:hypothetical protein